MKLNDKAALAGLRARIESALEPISENLEISFRVGNCRFEENGDGAVFKLEVERVGAEPKFERDLRERFELWGVENMLCGMNDEHCGQKFKLGVLSYEVVGLKGRVKSKPIVARACVDGKLYRFEIWDVAAAFGIETKPVVTEFAPRA